MYLVAALEPQVLVDLATSDGALYLGFCQAIESLKLEAEAISVWPRSQEDAEDDVAPDTLDLFPGVTFWSILTATGDLDRSSGVAVRRAEHRSLAHQRRSRGRRDGEISTSGSRS